MNRHRFHIPATIVAMLLCCQAMAGDLAGRGDALQAALDAGDTTKVANIYGWDGRLMPPNGEPIVGREAIQIFWADTIASGIRIRIEVEEMKQEGHLGYRMGAFEMIDAEGNVVDDGKYVEVWKKRDGHWWLEIDIWNSNRPAAAPSP